MTLFNEKLYISFLSSSPKDKIFKHTQISLALLCLGRQNNRLMLLLESIFNFFIAVTVELYHKGEQYKLEQ